ncbi:MAG: hypothetical protein V2I33_03580 [Kangiellaceae bacterium]|nr:hypothetical protein [Kangiellaceae bacterium]
MIKRQNKTTQLLKVMFFTALLASCSQTSVDAQVGNSIQPIEHANVANENKVDLLNQRQRVLSEKIMGLTTNKQCNVTADCAIFAMGMKSCGGAASYQVYSKLYTDQAIISQLANEFNKNSQTINQLTGKLSTCEITPKPTAICQENLCRAVIAHDTLC